MPRWTVIRPAGQDSPASTIRDAAHGAEIGSRTLRVSFRSGATANWTRMLDVPMMTLEFKMTQHGIELTDAQLDECRGYAIAETLANHHDEFESARLRHIALKMKWVKAQLDTSNARSHFPSGSEVK